jgi:hypothetical protein
VDLEQGVVIRCTRITLPGYLVTSRRPRTSVATYPVTTIPIPQPNDTTTTTNYAQQLQIDQDQLTVSDDQEAVDQAQENLSTDEGQRRRRQDEVLHGPINPTEHSSILAHGGLGERGSTLSLPSLSRSITDFRN